MNQNSTPRYAIATSSALLQKILQRGFLATAGMLFFALPTSAVAAEQNARMNVLMIVVDDLRPALGCYGDGVALTPNIDRLARQGTVFEHAYCQQAVCGPSRHSFLSGMRPDSTQAWDNSTTFRQANPQAVSLPQHFKNNGYQTQGIGKVFHNSGVASKDPQSWSVQPHLDLAGSHYALPENRKGKGLKRASVERADDDYLDGRVCKSAVAAIEQYAGSKAPFFLAVGFRKPHLPFAAPQKYWDLYDREKIPAPLSNAHPKGAPKLATRPWQELEGYQDIPSDLSLSAEKIQELRHGYYACVSFTDALMGQLLDTLARTQLDKNTIVLLFGDHGFHLGEQGLWTKTYNYELSTRVPLIISVPGEKSARSKALVELVDVFPTLAQLCGLDIPANLEGTSMAPLLAAPELAWKQAAFSQFPRARKKARYKSHGDVMGYAVRTENLRYVEWKEWQSGKVLHRELYDLAIDPQEMTNSAENSKYAPQIERLSQLLSAGWQHAKPPKDSLAELAPHSP